MNANQFERVWCGVFLFLFALAFSLAGIAVGVALKAADWIGATGEALVGAFFLFGVYVYRVRLSYLAHPSNTDSASGSPAQTDAGQMNKTLPSRSQGQP